MQSVKFGILAILGTLAFAPDAARSFEVPLTPIEKTSMLMRVAQDSAVWPALYRSGVPALGNSSLPSGQHARYLAAGLAERVSIAQRIGEEGVERYAALHRLKSLLSPGGMRSPTGPDSVYFNRTTGGILVLEAKGGSSARKWTYDSMQGTNKNTIRSAKGLLLRSGTTTVERHAAARVIKAAQGGRLETRIIRTSHVLGAPGSPTLDIRPNVTNVAREARRIEVDLVGQRPELRSVFRRAGRQGVFRRFVHAGSRVTLPVAVGVSGVTFAAGTYQLASGAIDYREFFLENAETAYFSLFTVGGAVIGGVSTVGVGAGAGAAIGGLIAFISQFAFDSFHELHHRDYFDAQQDAIDRAVDKHYLGMSVVEQ